MRKDQGLTAAAFDKFLAWLDPFRDRAATKYEDIRLSLIVIFRCRGCVEAEELADEAIDRVVRRIDQMVDTYVGDPAAYFYTVAHHLHLEHLKKKPPLSTMPVADLAGAAPRQADDEQAYNCLERCMQRLSPEDRALVMQYYQVEKPAKIGHRKRLADQMGIGLNALRIRLHRLRASLYECIHNCLENGLNSEMD